MAKEVRLDLSEATVLRVRNLFPRLEIRRDGDGEYVSTTPEIADLVEDAIRGKQGAESLQDRLDAPPAHDGGLLGLRHRYSHALIGFGLGVLVAGELVIPLITQETLTIDRRFDTARELYQAMHNSRLAAGIITPLLAAAIGFVAGYVRELSSRLR